MDKIIFLDFDGVLNCDDTFKNTYGLRKSFNYVMKDMDDSFNYNQLRFRLKLLELDFNKVKLLKEIIDLTDAKVVVTSSWKKFWGYSLFEEYLVSLGIPIIGVTKNSSNISEEIDQYIKENDVKHYIILDDSLFYGFSEEQKYNLVRTNYYQDGLNEESVLEATLKLGLKMR